jgi:hypothetical protein
MLLLKSLPLSGTRQVRQWPLRLVLSIILLLSAIGCDGSSRSGSAESDAAPHVSTQVELFLDDVVISSTENLTRVLKQPAKHPSNPLIIQDQPWEDRLVEVYGTVIYDQAQNIYKCWYRASSESIASPEYYVCYAESADGITWTKPSVGRQDFGPYAALTHNVVIPDGHGISVLNIPSDPVAGRVYKAGGGDITAFSPDG